MSTQNVCEMQAKDLHSEEFRKWLRSLPDGYKNRVTNDISQAMSLIDEVLREFSKQTDYQLSVTI